MARSKRKSGALEALFAKLNDVYGDDVYTKLETKIVDGRRVLTAFSIVMPYAREMLKWLHAVNFNCLFSMIKQFHISKVNVELDIFVLCLFL